MTTLDETLQQHPELSEFQQALAAKLLRVVRGLPPESVSVRAQVASPGTGTDPELMISLTPRAPRCAQVNVVVETHTYVRMAAGASTVYSLPDDVYDPRTADVPKFVVQIAQAVIAGKLEDTVYFRGDVPVKWTSRLALEGRPLCTTRVALLRTLRLLLRRQSRKTVSYPPYEATGTEASVDNGDGD